MKTRLSNAARRRHYHPVSWRLTMLDTAVAFFIFSRPDTTRKVWARIREARPARLFLVADGPRPGRPAESAKCAEVRRLVADVDWPCEVKRNYSVANLGAAVRVSSGLDWVFSDVEEAIILEDDCLPDPSFFPFCVELLERYHDESRIAQIAGCSFQDPGPEPTSYYFSRYPHSWGWATWRRAWKLYDHSMQTWRDGRAADWLATVVEHSVERKMWGRSFDATLSGNVDAWDYRWTFAIWQARMLSIVPYRNLISNIGFGEGATHTTAHSPWAALPLASMPFPLVHPTAFQRDVVADDHTSRRVFRPLPLPERLHRRWRRIFRR